MYELFNLTPTDLYRDRNGRLNTHTPVVFIIGFNWFTHLWFLFQQRDAVNIKLSDYGISRQSFHEGVLGVEGTPGYQAPEVRPGIVYDEKVLNASALFLMCSVLTWLVVRHFSLLAAGSVVHGVSQTVHTHTL